MNAQVKSGYHGAEVDDRLDAPSLCHIKKRLLENLKNRIEEEPANN